MALHHFYYVSAAAAGLQPGHIVEWCKDNTCQKISPLENKNTQEVCAKTDGNI